MDLSAWYLPIKHAHIGLVTASGVLFAVRGAAVQAGQGWAMRLAWRRLSYGIDTVLLAAGVGLWWLLQLNPVTSPWLGSKLLLLLVYIALGSLALKRGRTPAVRRWAYAAALAVFLLMASVARSHDALGLLRGLA